MVNIKPKPPRPLCPRELIQDQDGCGENIPRHSWPWPEIQPRLPFPAVGLCYLSSAFRESFESDPIVGGEQCGSWYQWPVHRKHDGYRRPVGVDGVSLVRRIAVSIQSCNCRHIFGGMTILDSALGSQFKGPSAIADLKVMFWAPVELLIGCHTALLGGVRTGIEGAEARP